MGRKRFENIQALRGVAVLLVLGRHAHICFGRLTGGTGSLDTFPLGDLGVDLFFVISGFVLTISTPAPLPDWRAVKVFLYNRATRIFPLYWLYMLPTIWVYRTHREWLHRYDKNLPISVIKSLLLWPQRGMPMLGQGWSLTYELYYYLVFAGLLLLPSHRFVRGLLCWALAVTLANAWMTLTPYRLPVRPEWWVACNLQSMEFIAGAMVGVGCQHARMTQFRAATGWLIIGGVVAWAMVVLVPLGFPLPASVRIFGYGAPALALVFGGVTLESNGVVLPSLLARVGQYSYSIYLSHILVLSAIVQFWPGHQIHGWPSAVGIGLLMCGGAVGVGAISYHWFEQPMLTWSRRWLAQHGRTLATPPPAPALVNAGRGEANVTL